MTSEGDASSAEDRVALRSAPVSSSASSRPKTKPTAYIDDLIAENQRLKSNSGIGSQPRAANLLPDLAVVTPVKETTDTNATAIPAPSLDERPWFFDMNIPHTPILIGEASDAAFATRFRQAISSAESSHIPRVNYATDERLLALSDTDCPWPSPARARFLVGVALRYVSRCYHIIRKSSILDALEQTLQNPAESDSLLKSKLWAMFAIGAMYSTRSATSEKHFPGMGYFARATRILRIVSERPRIDVVELRLLLSFYSLALNRRHTAYTFAGSATRLAVVMGLHLNVPETQLRDAAAREHRVRVWWTAYIFDRMWAAKLSHPVAVQDIDIEVDLPSNPVVDDNIADDFADASYFVASVKLAGLLGKVVPSIYRRRLQDTSLSHRVQEALKDLRGWSAELPPQLHIDSKPTSERMPKPISLHLNFNQASNEARLCDGYLFSAATILAASSLLSGKESHNDREQFEEAAQFLSQLKDNGNYAAEEFCHHIDAMKPTMAAAHMRRGDFAVAGDSAALLNDTTAAFTDATVNLNQPFAEQNTTAGMALNEPSLQELLAQPLLDLQFIDASIYNDGAQGLYWPDFSPESWTPETWTAT
ncbi:fungal specific transcription factor domain-containing protein [Colletotrichum simmondsii]|uniref:Fungal specific transcription factor domain-containing protein n=1 Tax=Colletotrichum simmondsii TaxID=703756 RepID=A0A135SDM2_9PEZI|nr:fungal specific transcription factor domain-containing protein [Colletotrichum simmondsii]